MIDFKKGNFQNRKKQWKKLRLLSGEKIDTEESKFMLERNIVEIKWVTWSSTLWIQQ